MKKIFFSNEFSGCIIIKAERRVEWGLRQLRHVQFHVFQVEMGLKSKFLNIFFEHWLIPTKDL